MATERNEQEKERPLRKENGGERTEPETNRRDNPQMYESGGHSKRT